MAIKFNVESAYRDVHSDDRYLLGMKWRGNYFIDLALPFGLRSALRITLCPVHLLFYCGPVRVDSQTQLWHEVSLTLPG